MYRHTWSFIFRIPYSPYGHLQYFLYWHPFSLKLIFWIIIMLKVCAGCRRRHPDGSLPDIDIPYIYTLWLVCISHDSYTDTYSEQDTTLEEIKGPLSCQSFLCLAWPLLIFFLLTWGGIYPAAAHKLYSLWNFIGGVFLPVHVPVPSQSSPSPVLVLVTALCSNDFHSTCMGNL